MRYDLLHPKAVRAALIGHLGPEYRVPTERQVRRWINGDTPWPGWARSAVDELMGTTKEALRPDWAEGLATKDDLETMIAESIIPVVARQVVSSLREAGLLPPVAPVPDTED